ncbi:MAG: SlyX family protein [Alphaproteobacteria bacterium]|nr:SlyX family protein [Alphaproteobacteria bacterium]MDY4689010.1 SlyX family protein [Alphaproteobacteria bacterium]
MIDLEINQRLIAIEMTLDNQQKALDDLSEMVVKQGKIIDNLTAQNNMLKSMLSQDIVKPQSEETPPPHY